MGGRRYSTLWFHNIRTWTKLKLIKSSGYRSDAWDERGKSAARMGNEMIRMMVMRCSILCLTLEGWSGSILHRCGLYSWGQFEILFMYLPKILSSHKRSRTFSLTITSDIRFVQPFDVIRTGRNFPSPCKEIERHRADSFFCCLHEKCERFPSVPINIFLSLAQPQTWNSIQ